MLTQEMVGLSIGMKSSALSQIRKGKTARPSPAAILLLNERYGIDPVWIKYGIGEMLAGNDQTDTFAPGEYTLVPRYGVEGSTGPGAVIEGEELVDYMAFKTEWMKRDLGGSREDFFLIHVRGESMEPTLRAGDLIMVDRREKTFRFDAIYLFRSQGSLLVKRIQNLPNGESEVISDNTAYKPYRINPADTHEDFEVIGRMVWYSRQI